MIQKPEITILMPVRNAAACIENAVDSILAQLFGCWELFVIDLGSEDDTLDKLRKYHDVRILLRSASSRSDALHMCIMESSGKYIALMDPEYTMLPDKLGIQYSTMETESSITLCSSGCSFMKERVKTGEQFLKEKGKIMYPLLAFLVDSPFIEPSVMLRKDFLLKEVGLHRTEFYDGDLLSLWIEMAKRRAVFYVDPRCLITLDHDRVLVDKDDSTLFNKSIRIKLLEYLLESASSPELDALYSSLCSCSRARLIDADSVVTRMRDILWHNKHKLYKTKIV